MAELLNVKLKHVSVLQAEMAEQLIPPKVSSNFKDAQDLKASNIKKEKLSKQAKIICNWIYKTPLNGSPPAKANKTMQHKLKLNTKINFHGVDPLNLCSIMDQSKLSDGDCFSTYSLGSPRDDIKNSTYKSTIGRDKALISGSTTSRRNQTIGLLRNEFNSINDPVNPDFISASIYDAKDAVPTTIMNLERDYFRKQSTNENYMVKASTNARNSINETTLLVDMPTDGNASTTSKNNYFQGLAI